MKILFILLAGAGCLGILVISRGTADEHYYFFRQLSWFGFSSLMLMLVSSLNLDIMERNALILYSCGLALLSLVLFFGIRINGMKGWFHLYGAGCQPSELLKPVFILCFARLLSGKRFSVQRFQGLFLSFILLGFWLGLILLQPDGGTALIYALVFLAMVWTGGAKTWQLLATGMSFLPAAGIMLWRYPYMRRRLEGFFHSSPEILQGSGWHASVMEKSLQNGGWFGKMFSADPTLIWIPYRSNDSIFAGLSEQMGFIGVLPLVLLVFCWLAFCCFRAMKTRSEYHRLLYMGCAVMLSGQAFLHLGVNLGVFPTTGVTFPLISYGGSSLFACMIIAGIVDYICWQEKQAQKIV